MTTSTHQPRRLVCSPAGAGGGWELRPGLQSDAERGLGCLREHSLKGANVPQLAKRESGKNSGPKSQETVVSGCMRRGDSEHCLNELQRQARAAAISADPRDGHETLRLLLQPPRSLWASTGHYPLIPSWEPVQPATAWVP